MSVERPGHYQPSRHGAQVDHTASLATTASTRMLSQAEQFSTTLGPSDREALRVAARKAREAARLVKMVKANLDRSARPRGRPRGS